MILGGREGFTFVSEAESGATAGFATGGFGATIFGLSAGSAVGVGDDMTGLGAVGIGGSGRVARVLDTVGGDVGGWCRIITFAVISDCGSVLLSATASNRIGLVTFSSRRAAANGDGLGATFGGFWSEIF